MLFSNPFLNYLLPNKLTYIMKENQHCRVPVLRYLKKLLVDVKVLLLVLLFGASNTISGFDLQQLTVTGTVTEASTGDPMPGVNVIIKGTVQ